MDHVLVSIAISSGPTPQRNLSDSFPIPMEHFDSRLILSKEPIWKKPMAAKKKTKKTGKKEFLGRTAVTKVGNSRKKVTRALRGRK